MSSNLEYPKICAHCGTRFIAKKLSTLYCSHKCSQRAYKQKLKLAKLALAVDDVKDYARPPLLREEKNNQKSNPSVINIPNLNNKEVLSLLETARLMGVGKTSIHRYCTQGKLNCIKMNRKIFVRRSDIEELFDYAPIYQVTHRKDTDPKTKVIEAVENTDGPITDFYSVDEVSKKYGITKSAVHKRVATNKIPKMVYQGRTLLSRTHIDDCFKPKIDTAGVDKWYTVEQIKERYTMSTSAVYTLVSDNQVPRKNEHGKSIYSKEHIDALLAHRLDNDDISQWYTVEDIFEKYGLRPGYVANFVYKNQIPKRRVGGKGYYSKEHFDAALRAKQPSLELITIEDAAEQFALSTEQIRWIIRSNNIEKIKSGKLIKVSRAALERVINPPKI